MILPLTAPARICVLNQGQPGGTNTGLVDVVTGVTASQGATSAYLPVILDAAGKLGVSVVPVFGASGINHAGGAVPDPGATAGTQRFLREDSTFTDPLQNPTALGLFHLGVPDTSLLTDVSSEFPSVYTINRLTSHHASSPFSFTGTITSLEITNNVLSVSATNSFVVGQKVEFEFMNPATFLNGVVVEVSGATAGGFTADYTHADYLAAADAGYADGSGNLVLFGAVSQEDISIGSDRVFGIVAQMDIDTNTPYTVVNLPAQFPAGVVAVTGNAFHQGAGAITGAMYGTIGGQFASGVLQATGKIDTAVGVLVDIRNVGTINNVYGTYITSLGDSGATSSNSYAVYIQAQTGGATNVWGIYEAGTNEKNLLGMINLGGTDTSLSRTSAGVVSIGTGAVGNADGTLNSQGLIVNTATSPTTGATGTGGATGNAGATGQIMWDSDFLYICIQGGATGAALWKRSALL